MPKAPCAGLDWRTAVVALGAAVAFGLLPIRWQEPRDLVLLGIWFAALTVLVATDLDQRLLPDLVTLPLIPIGSQPCCAAGSRCWRARAGSSRGVAGHRAPLCLVVRARSSAAVSAWAT